MKIELVFAWYMIQDKVSSRQHEINMELLDPENENDLS
jgi:hypothetical protein